MGMYVGGEIADLAAIARPSIGVVTAVQPVHLSPDRLARGHRAGQGRAARGAARRRHGDPQRRRPDRRADGPADRGAGPALRLRRDADVARRRGRRAPASTGMRFRLRTPGRRARRSRIPALGRLSVHNALAAAAVGLAAGLDLDTIVAGLAGGWRAPHRGRGRPAARRDRSSTTATTPRRARCVAALDLLAGLPGRRVAVLGEMLELGEGHEAGHVAVGEAAGRDGRAARRRRARGAAGSPTGATRRRPRRRRGSTTSRDGEAALDALRPRLRDGDAVLVKASRGIGLDRLVDAPPARARRGRPR